MKRIKRLQCKPNEGRVKELGMYILGQRRLSRDVLPVVKHCSPLPQRAGPKSNLDEFSRKTF